MEWPNSRSGIAEQYNQVRLTVEIEPGADAKFTTKSISASINGVSKGITISRKSDTQVRLACFHAQQFCRINALAVLADLTNEYAPGAVWVRSDARYFKCMSEMGLYEDLSRMDRLLYNDSVTKLDQELRRFPASAFGRMLGFQKREYIEGPENEIPICRLSPDDPPYSAYSGGRAPPDSGSEQRSLDAQRFFRHGVLTEWPSVIRSTAKFMPRPMRSPSSG